MRRFDSRAPTSSASTKTPGRGGAKTKLNVEWQRVQPDQVGVKIVAAFEAAAVTKSCSCPVATSEAANGSTDIVSSAPSFGRCWPDLGRQQASLPDPIAHRRLEGGA